MSTRIQAIETTYRGIKFRSRTEARWAVFLDAFGLNWEYEKEGYSLPPTEDSETQETLYYLPDFFIPVQRRFPKALWMEVKGVEGEHDWEKLTRLCEATGINGAMVGSIPNIPPNRIDVSGGTRYRTFHTYDLDELQWQKTFGGEGGCDVGYCFCQCPFCASLGYEFNGRSARVGCGCPGHKDIMNGDKTYNNATPALIKAYAMARSERFGT